MEKKDISAVVTALEAMVTRLKDNTNNVDRPITFAAVKVLLTDLREAAKGIPGENNIRGVLMEVEVHARGLAGLHPSYDRSEQDHYQFALNSISKLSLPTVFDL